MKCPVCNGDTKVIDSRFSDRNGTRRRRECTVCMNRITTYEVIAENIPAKATPEQIVKLQTLSKNLDEAITELENSQT